MGNNSLTWEFEMFNGLIKIAFIYCTDSKRCAEISRRRRV